MGGKLEGAIHLELGNKQDGLLFISDLSICGTLRIGGESDEGKECTGGCGIMKGASRIAIVHFRIFEGR
jgi:hypothetical protein